MPRKAPQVTPYTKQEKAFFEAIDRILQGKPKHKDLQPAALAKNGRKLRVTVDAVSMEAGYARTYLYKNRTAMVRVWRRVEEVTRPQKPAATIAETFSKLRAEIKQVKDERGMAVDVARRWFMRGRHLEQQVDMLRRELDRLNKAANSRPDNVVAFANTKKPGE